MRNDKLEPYPSEPSKPESLFPPLFFCIFVPFHPWTNLQLQMKCEGQCETWNAILTFFLRGNGSAWADGLLQQWMCVHVSVNVCVCVCEPLSTFLFVCCNVVIMLLVSFISYGAFSTCVSYLCICRLTFQSQSPQHWMLGCSPYWDIYIRQKSMYILITYICTSLCITTTSD